MVVVVFRKVKRLGDFVLSDQGLGIAKVPFGFPSVFCCGITLPSNQEGVATRFSSMSEDCFDFIFFFAVY